MKRESLYLVEMTMTGPMLSVQRTTKGQVLIEYMGASLWVGVGSEVPEGTYTRLVCLGELGFGGVRVQQILSGQKLEMATPAGVKK